MMSAPIAIYRKGGKPLIDASFDVLKTKTPIFQKIRAAIGPIYNPVRDTVRLYTGAKLNDMRRQMRGVIENEHALYTARRHGVNGKPNLEGMINILRDKQRNAPQNIKDRIKPIIDELSAHSRRDPLVNNGLDDIYKKVKGGSDPYVVLSRQMFGVTNPNIAGHFSATANDYIKALKASAIGRSVALGSILPIGAGIQYAQYRKAKQESNAPTGTRLPYPKMLSAVSNAISDLPKAEKNRILKEHKGERIAWNAINNVVVAAGIPIMISKMLGIPKKEVFSMYYRNPMAGAGLGLAALANDMSVRNWLYRKHVSDEALARKGITRHNKHYYTFSPNAKKRYSY